MSSAISAMILDLDGTLLDSKQGILESFAFAVSTVFPGRKFDVLAVTIGPPLQRMFENSFPKASEADIDGLSGAFRRHYDREGFLQARLYEGAMELLSGCRDRGIAVDIATNKLLHISKAILAHLEVAPYIRSVVSRDSVQPAFAGKAEIIEHLLRIHHLKPGEALYVGDAADDAAGCAACGVRFVWAAYGYGTLTGEQVKSVWATIHNLGEIPPLLA